MLVLMVGATEGFDEEKQEFVTYGGTRLEFEHSLSSVSKWESSHEKPFLSGKRDTQEVLDYIRCMCISPEVPADLSDKLTQADINAVQEYIEAKMTATWFATEKNPRSTGETVTSELIYYWMVALNIPFECQYWHLNRLLTLIKVINKKNEPEKKMSRRDIAARNRQLNAERKAQMGTRG